MIVIDTNIAVHARDGNPGIVGKLGQRGSSVAIALPTLIELEGGVYAKPALAGYRRATLDRLLTRFDVLDLDRDVVTAYGQIIAARGFSRPRVIDRLIAATAIVHDLTLVTIDGDDFRDVPNLKLEVWPAPAQ